MTNLNFRQWQSVNILRFVSNFFNKKEEVTIAHQGSGKTLYSAGCFAASSLNINQIEDITIENLKTKLKNQKDKTHFAIIFIPKNVITENTIRDWQTLGITLKRFTNKEITKSSPKKLLEQGIDGLIVTYSQIINNGYNGLQAWTDNVLISFINKDKNLIFHAILDEAHTLNMLLNSDLSRVIKRNLAAKYFLANQGFFNKLHLISGTMIKGLRSRIPFVSYTPNRFLIKPDTLYTKQDSIKDKNIVQTKIAIHRLETLEVLINDKKVIFSDDDLEFYQKNAHLRISATQNQKAFNEEIRKTIRRLDEIEKSFTAATKNIDLWKQLIYCAQSWLDEIKQDHYSKCRGIIFCPSVSVAIDVHKKLLFENSILCVSKSIDHDFFNTKLISPITLLNVLKITNSDLKIDWIITCEALTEGFDFPDIKVNVLIPRLEFLSFKKVSQALGRTNRIVPENEKLQAVCLTLKYGAIIDLIKKDEENMFGLIYPEQPYSDLVKYNNQLTIDSAKKSARKLNDNNDDNDDRVIINDLKISNEFNLYVNGQEKKDCYTKTSEQQIEEIRIRSFCPLWEDIVYSNNENENIKFPPSNLAGCYTIFNATNQQIIYIGSSHDLLRRISDKNRYRKAKWVDAEGYGNLYVKWEVTNNYKIRERELKELNPPKYDGEKY